MKTIRTLVFLCVGSFTVYADVVDVWRETGINPQGFNGSSGSAWLTYNGTQGTAPDGTNAFNYTDPFTANYSVWFAAPGHNSPPVPAPGFTPPTNPNWNVPVLLTNYGSQPDHVSWPPGPPNNPGPPVWVPPVQPPVLCDPPPGGGAPEVPEPGTFAMLGFGGTGLAYLVKRRRTQ